ncbi:hypothetical protein QR98_0060000 [Sarcoptes scabiei]|nr:hypothetical protein QR98_0060000 [Sarcoptes scabiei]
MSLKKS